MQLSPSKIGVLNNCPRCFYMANNMSVRRPRGIFPSLPGGMDLVLKKYYDRYRILGILPSEVTAQISGEKPYSDIEKLKKWRNWQSKALTIYIDEVKIIGALDDAVINLKEEISPYDYKTKGSEPKDDGSQYYQHQLDIYELMLKEKGFKTSGYAYLAYYFPVEVESMADVQFRCKIYKIKTSTANAIAIIKRAKKLLKGKMPAASNDCQYCAYESQKVLNRIVVLPKEEG